MTIVITQLSAELFVVMKWIEKLNDRNDVILPLTQQAWGYSNSNT